MSFLGEDVSTALGGSEVIVDHWTPMFANALQVNRARTTPVHARAWKHGSLVGLGFLRPTTIRASSDSEAAIHTGSTFVWGG